MKKMFNVLNAVVCIMLCLFAIGSSNLYANEKIIIKIAHTQNYVPYTFVDGDGKSDGFEIQVLKEINKLLPNYEFKFYPTSDEDLLVGLETGKYDLAVKGAWYTAKRAEKLIFPKHPIGASIIGITVRSVDQSKIRIKGLKSFAKYSGRLVPISPESAQWSIIEEFNKDNPKTPIKLIPSEKFIITEAYNWVLEGRYDAFLDLKVSYDNQVLKEGGSHHDLAGKLTYIPYLSVATYPMFNKSQQKLADEYDHAMKALEKQGTLLQLSNKYFGENIFQYTKNNQKNTKSK